MNRLPLSLVPLLACLLLACMTAPVSAQSAGTHEPAGLRPIIDIAFGATKLPVAWVRAPQSAYGLRLGQAEAERSARVAAGRSGQPGDFAHRCWFPQNHTSQAGKGVGCTLYLKESDPYNSDGNTRHSYRLWYERGYLRWGNVDAAGNVLPNFESASPTGLKLLGYWGVACPGNIVANQVIGWMAPSPRNSTGQGKPQSHWTFEWRAQICAGTTWNNYSRVLLQPGPGWHQYEVLLDAGDIGAANGSLTFWLDGQPLTSYTNVPIRTAARPRGWFGRHWNPVQGGGCGVMSPACGRDHAGVLDIDDVYVSVGSPVD